MSKKLKIRTSQGHMSPYDFEGTLGQLRDRIEGSIREHGENARLDWQPTFYYPYDNEPSPRFEILVEQEETDEEYEKRMEKSRADNAVREARERAEFERLAKKYGAK